MKTRPNTIDTVAQNIRMLNKEFGWRVPQLAKKSHVPTSTIYSILNKSRTPGVDTTDEIARAFGLSGWMLLIPNLTHDLKARGRLQELLEKYNESSDATQEYINTVLNRELRNGTN